MNNSQSSFSKLLASIKPLASYGVYAAFTIALLSTLISLYFSEIQHLVPCVLCWYQRIAMYPLVAIIGTSILRNDRLAWIYSLPLVVFGAAVALYHTLLQWGFISESLAPCQAGVSCAKVTWEIFGFITIPFGSLVAFIGIAACLWAARWAQK